MNWTRIGLAILACGVATTFTDWLFMGVLFHKKYLAFPEVWRIKPGEPDAALIFWSQVVGLVSCAGFVLVCAGLGFHTWRATLKLAGMVWAMGPVPILIQNLLWTKIHPLITLAHLSGWLVRFLVCAGAFVLLAGS
ncbi:MAG TPA: DUF1761 domain-containing protein [Candidatus Binatia bacterium]|nr:DUF1761 domain-containing protein [Candidatus Binatia bacterium]